MNKLIENLNTKKAIYEPYTNELKKYLKITYFSKKINFILNIKREMLNNTINGLIKPIKKKEGIPLFKTDSKSNSLFAFNFNKADMDNINSLLQITNREYNDNRRDYKNTLMDSEDKYKSYNEEYNQLKNILNTYFYEIYCLNKEKKKRLSLKKYNYQNIGKPSENVSEIGKKPSISHQISFIKAKLIAWDKISFKKGSDEYKRSNKSIQKIVNKKEECEELVRNVVKRYKNLFNSTDEKQKIINELNLYIGALFTYRNGIEIKFNGKKKTLTDLFDRNKEKNGGKLFIKSLFLLAPIKIDEKYKKEPEVERLEKERKEVIDYEKLKEVEEAFTKIKTTQKRIPFDEFHKKLFVQLNKAEELFKDSKSIYMKSKKDLLTLSELFFFTGKNYEHHNTSYLKKFINDILMAHYKSLFILINVKNFITNFKNNKERERFTKIFIKTDIEARMLGSYSHRTQNYQQQQYRTLRGGTLDDIQNNWINNPDKPTFEPMSVWSNHPHYLEPPKKRKEYKKIMNDTLSPQNKKATNKYLYQKDSFYTELKKKIEEKHVNDKASLDFLINTYIKTYI